MNNNLENKNIINSDHFEPEKFDIERMKKALAQESIQMPIGLSREEKRQFMLDKAKELSGE